MNEYERSIKIAKEIASVLKNIKEVKAIAIGGGVVIGKPDKYSDIDIYCFSTKLPELKKRKEILNQLKLDRFKGQDSNPKISWSIDLFFYKRKAVGVEYIGMPYINKNITKIKKKGYISRDDFVTVNKIIYNKSLWDPDKIISNYRKDLRKYLKKVRTYAKSLWQDVEFYSKKWDWPGGGGIHTAIKRKNYIWIDQLIKIQIYRYLFCLYALNNLFYHEFLGKWAHKQIKDFKYKPKNCVKRLEKISLLGNKGEELDKKIKLLNQLIKDTSPLMKKL